MKIKISPNKGLTNRFFEDKYDDFHTRWYIDYSTGVIDFVITGDKIHTRRCKKSGTGYKRTWSYITVKLCK